MTATLCPPPEPKQRKSRPFRGTFAELGTISREFNAGLGSRLAEVHTEVRPGDHVYAIVEEGARQHCVTTFRWGWHPDQPHKRLYQARLETADHKKTWQMAFRYYRCIIPFATFRVGGVEVAEEGRSLWVAGIYHSVNGVVATLTMDSKGELAELAPRQPVIVPKHLASVWLSHHLTDADSLRPLLTDHVSAARTLF